MYYIRQPRFLYSGDSTNTHSCSYLTKEAYLGKISNGRRTIYGTFACRGVISAYSSTKSLTCSAAAAAAPVTVTYRFLICALSQKSGRRKEFPGEEMSY
jgi:hypothetical protein